MPTMLKIKRKANSEYAGRIGELVGVHYGRHTKIFQSQKFFCFIFDFGRMAGVPIWFERSEVNRTRYFMPRLKKEL